ncbi:LOW QUALITY PROTEIN: Terpene synthase family protein [Colletotrichum higginsianum IMI 349063]|uniref:Terpene synthase family protein n=1 Tax=Colletotrichum higginsianum (strain IMI 349063) TaxID=759273 RepID=A0A1B7YVM8_COLHI|nr:LOW QUALITY PROTEIN: Terpene synthase family protein [Colletotrichum higginsianum IMI 349063]OBR16105.1 LOW QUALITY PROTEIN: Terpene synthase family protein [Colletotrichum higginsianum IMI 349063]
MDVAHTESAQLISRLEGQVMIIPDLRGMISHWPSGKNVHCNVIDVLINHCLQDCDAFPQDLANVRDANPTLLASSTLTLMVLWQGKLDDYIEALEYQSQAKSREFRFRVKEYIAQYLELSEGPKEPATSSIISTFQPVARMICQQYNKDQRRRLKASLFEYIDSTVQETRYVESGEVPTDLKYEMLRKKTGGTGPLCSEYPDGLGVKRRFADGRRFATGLQWPSFVFDSHPYKMMLQAVAIIVGLFVLPWVENIGKAALTTVQQHERLALVRKGAGRILNAVPVRLWNSREGGDLASVVRSIVDDIEKAIRHFDACERRLITKSREDADTTRKIAATLKTICTGNLTWSLACKRYNVGKPAADGSLRQELRAGE